MYRPKITSCITTVRLNDLLVGFLMFSRKLYTYIQAARSGWGDAHG